MLYHIWYNNILLSPPIFLPNPSKRLLWLWLLLPITYTIRGRWYSTEGKPYHYLLYCLLFSLCFHLSFTYDWDYYYILTIIILKDDYLTLGWDEYDFYILLPIIKIEGFLTRLFVSIYIFPFHMVMSWEGGYSLLVTTNHHTLHIKIYIPHLNNKDIYIPSSHNKDRSWLYPYPWNLYYIPIFSLLDTHLYR